MLDPGHDTVGTHVNVWHKAAAPMGSSVTFTAELLDVSFEAERARRVEFRVSATQGEKVIGEGTHQRAIVNVRRFKEKVAE
jgi:predicted thioesterase